MEKLILPKDKINELVEKALVKYQVFAPVENDGLILFNHITNPSEITLEFSNAKIPPKAILFQQTETLFKFTRGKSVKIEANEKENKTIILGIRPCDAKSLAVLDNVFKDEYEDPYYLMKRENTILIGLSCTQPEVNCFCTSFNGTPTSTKDVDIQLTDIGEKYYVEVITNKGKEFVKSMNELFASATEKDEKIKEEIEKKAFSAISRHMNIDDVVENLDKIFDSQFWEKLAMKCLGCGACTYLCPTCHCFDIQDESTLTKGARVRIWDSCMYSEYTLQASGYNPRPARMNRIRNRIYHKYNYFPKNYDMIACVGCGRCIDTCPVNIDIIDVINKVREVGK